MLDWCPVQIPTRAGAILIVKKAGPGHDRTCSAVDILKATRQGAAPGRCGCRLGCTRCGAYWRHLTNTIEPFVYGSVVALCQIIYFDHLLEQS